MSYEERRNASRQITVILLSAPLAQVCVQPSQLESNFDQAQVKKSVELIRAETMLDRLLGRESIYKILKQIL